MTAHKQGSTELKSGPFSLSPVDDEKHLLNCNTSYIFKVKKDMFLTKFSQGGNSAFLT